MPILRDYKCACCGNITEQFDDDEDDCNDVCPYCASIEALQPMLSAPNIKTSCKTNSKCVAFSEEFAGVSFQVGASGELGKQKKINIGEMIKIKDGGQMIVTGNPSPDMDVIKAYAKKMVESDKPVKEKMH